MEEGEALSPAVSGVTLQPKCDLSGRRGDALPPRLMTDLINSPNTMPFWAIDAVSFEIFKNTKYDFFGLLSPKHLSYFIGFHNQEKEVIYNFYVSLLFRLVREQGNITA